MSFRLLPATLLLGFTMAAPDFTPITNLMAGWVAKGYYPGCGILIGRGDTVLLEKYMGSNTPGTVTLVASVGKWLASATLMAVVDEGKLKLDDPVSKWLPEFAADPKGKATVRELFSHTSGFPTYQPKENPVDKYQTLSESVARILPLPPVAKPGERFEYGGLAMQVAGRMAEKATGRTWEEIFQSRIAGPCAMSNTRFTPVDDAPGHSPMLGGGLRTTVPDFARFLRMISQKGRYGDRRVLTEKAVAAMEADQVGGATLLSNHVDLYVKNARGAVHTGVYGLGLWREELDGKGQATLVSSPGWAGAYPWVDRKHGIYGFFMAHVDVKRPNPEKFSSFYASPVLAILAREAMGAKP